MAVSYVWLSIKYNSFKKEVTRIESWQSWISCLRAVFCHVFCLLLTSGRVLLIWKCSFFSLLSFLQTSAAGSSAQELAWYIKTRLDGVPRERRLNCFDYKHYKKGFDLHFASYCKRLTSLRPRYHHQRFGLNMSPFEVSLKHYIVYFLQKNFKRGKILDRNITVSLLLGAI